MTTKVDDFLEHYGVKGMRWGVTRDRVNGKLTPIKKLKSKKPAVPASKEHTQASSLKSKPLHAMTNDEIKTLTTRLQLETSYNRLTGADVKVVDKGREEVERYLKIGTTVAAVYALYQSPAGKAAKKLFEAKFKVKTV